MKKLQLLALLVICPLFGCGGSSAPDFEGVWNGSFTTLLNHCPFPVASDINPLFPMTVSVDENDNYTVVAVDGSIATGGQGQGETISFLAKADHFGNYGSIAPYTCTSSRSEVGYLTEGDNKAKVTLTVYFTGCTTPSSSKKPLNCDAIYYGEATR